MSPINNVPVDMNMQLFGSSITLRHVVVAFTATIVYLVYKIIYQLFLHPYFFSPFRKIPGPPLGDPLVGQFGNILRGEAGIVQREWTKTYGPVVRAVGPLGIERLIFMKPEAMQKILASDWIDYPRPFWMRDVLGAVTGYGLLTVTGNEHKQMRKAMNPAFSLPNLMAQTDMYYDPIEALVAIMESKVNSAADPSQGKEFLMYEWMSKVTLDIICEAAFGYKTDSLHNPHNELAEAYESLINLQSGPMMARMIALMHLPGFNKLVGSKLFYKLRHINYWIPGISPGAIVADAMHRIREVSAKMLDEKIADAAQVNASDTAAKRDIMSLLIRARIADKGDGYHMSDQAMMDQVLTFLGAGHETTASGLAWTLWLLANDIPSQEKLRKEVSALVAENPRPDYRSLKELQFLDCVVQESLRVFPPVPMTFREAGKSDYIDGVYVPAGTIFYIPIRGINTWKEVWGEDAEEFRPERWLNLPKNYNSTYSTLSFIAGPHACIGKTMSIIEMKAVLAVILSKFSFEPAFEGQVAKPTAAVTMKPSDNLPLRVKLVSQEKA